MSNDVMEITQEVINDLEHRMHSHTQVKDIAVVVLTARELEGLINLATSALEQGKYCPKCLYYVPNSNEETSCASCGNGM